MNSQRGLFISGLVLGVGVGLMLSHFMIGRSQPHEDSQLNDRFDLTWQVQSGAQLDHQFVAQLPPPEPYFPEEGQESGDDPEESPLRNALAVETASEVLQQTTNQLVPVNPSEPKNEPGPLQIGDAAPLAKNTARDQQTIRGIIDIELSHLPEEKRQVWFDALKDVNKEDVAGILKMWKLLGGPIPEAPVADSQFVPAVPGVHSQIAIGSNVASSESGKGSFIEEAKAIHYQNILNWNTPGYVRQVPYFIKTASVKNAKVDQLAVRYDFTGTRQIQTSFPLDLAIRGPGFFVVADSVGQRYYTRLGRFSLDSEHRIVLKSGSDTFVLQPEMKLELNGTGLQGLQIDEAGNVSVQRQGSELLEGDRIGKIQLEFPLSSEFLTSADAGIFRLKEENGPAAVLISAGSTSDTRIGQGFLELSNVDVASETACLKLLEDLKSVAELNSYGPGR